MSVPSLVLYKPRPAYKWPFEALFGGGMGQNPKIFAIFAQNSEPIAIYMEFSANQLASMVNGTVEGDGEVKVNTIAKIEEGHPGAISFLANPKYTHYIYTTGSSIVLVGRDFVPEQPVSATLVRVDDPYATVARLLQMASQMMNAPRRGVEQPASIAEGVTVPDDAYVGAFAYIGRGVKLGRGVQIYPQVYIGDNVSVGDGTVLYPGVRVYHGCQIGARCIVHAGAVIGADGFGFAPVNGHYDKIPQIGNVVIGDDVEIGANTTVDRATMGSTRIDRGVKLDNLIQVAHNCTIGEDTVIASQTGMAGSSHVGRGCMIGGQVGIAGHITIGDGTQIGAQSGIPRNIRPGSRMMGYPATDYANFARQAVWIKNLGDLYNDVRDLKARANDDK